MHASIVPYLADQSVRISEHKIEYLTHIVGKTETAIESETSFPPCQNRWQNGSSNSDRAWLLLAARCPAIARLDLTSSNARQHCLSISHGWQALGSALRSGRFPVVMEACLWAVVHGSGWDMKSGKRWLVPSPPRLVALVVIIPFSGTCSLPFLHSTTLLVSLCFANLSLVTPSLLYSVSSLRTKNTLYNSQEKKLLASLCVARGR